MNNRNEIKRELKRKSDLFLHVFGTPQGKEVLQIIGEECNPDVLFVDGDAHKTSYNIGKRDVFIYINQMLRFDNE